MLFRTDLLRIGPSCERTEPLSKFCPYAGKHCNLLFVRKIVAVRPVYTSCSLHFRAKSGLLARFVGWKISPEQRRRQQRRIPMRHNYSHAVDGQTRLAALAHPTFADSCSVSQHQRSSPHNSYPHRRRCVTDDIDDYPCHKTTDQLSESGWIV